MRFASLLVLSLALSVFAQERTKTDYSSFEQSLMKDHAVQSNSSSSNEFEQSLMNAPSEMEPVYKVREEILSALRQKDYPQVAKLMDELSAMESRTVIPVNDVEKEVIYIESKLYGKLLDAVVRYYRNVFDLHRYDNPTVAKNDGLDLYVRESLKKRNPEKNVFYSISEGMDFVKLSKNKREKLELFLLLRDAYRDKEIGKRVRELGESYVASNPDDPDSPWIKGSIVSPLSRMSMFDYTMEKRAENKEELIASKLYTGGFGLNLMLPMGGAAIGFDEFYRKDLFNAEETAPINLELYFQIWRIAALFELASSGISGLTTYGFGLGWVAYDSRHLKVRPYLAFGASFMDMSARAHVPNTNLYVDESELYGNDDGGPTITAAVNVDYKFGTAYLFLSDKKLVSFSLIGKFGASYIDFKNKYASGSGVSPFFSLGLGVYFW